MKKRYYLILSLAEFYDVSDSDDNHLGVVLWNINNKYRIK